MDTVQLSEEKRNVYLLQCLIVKPLIIIPSCGCVHDSECLQSTWGELRMNMVMSLHQEAITWVGDDCSSWPLITDYVTSWNTLFQSLDWENNVIMVNLVGFQNTLLQVSCCLILLPTIILHDCTLCPVASFSSVYSILYHFYLSHLIPLTALYK